MFDVHLFTSLKCGQQTKEQSSADGQQTKKQSSADIEAVHTLNNNYNHHHNCGSGVFKLFCR